MYFYNSNKSITDVLKKHTLQPFLDAVNTLPYKNLPQYTVDDLSANLFNRFRVEDEAFGDDMYFHGIFDYFEKKVLPHKIAVFKAGMSLLENEIICKLLSRQEREEFIQNLFIHDFSKFSANESFGYAMYNFETKHGKAGFEKAWHHHKMNNPHHPEYWVVINRMKQVEDSVEMPYIYVLEMVADWIGAGETYGKTLADWLPENLPKFNFEKSEDKVLRVLKAIGFNIEKIFSGGIQSVYYPLIVSNK